MTPSLTLDGPSQHGSAVRWLLPPGPDTGEETLRVGPGLPRASLEAMAREGLVRHLGHGIYLPCDGGRSRAARAGALVPLVPGWGVLALLAAAWVHGAPSTGPPVVVACDGTARSRRLGDDVRLLETRLPDRHVTALGGVRVTTAARTVADLARWGEDVRSREAARWLLDHVTGVEEVGAVMADQHRLRHQRRARERFASLVAGAPDDDLWAPADGPGSPGQPPTASRSAREPVTR